MRNLMEGVGLHNDISPEDNELMIKIRELVNSDPDLLGNEDIMKFVEVALFRASKNEPRNVIAKELDEELSGYLVKNKFKAPEGVKKLQAVLKPYTEVLQIVMSSVSQAFFNSKNRPLTKSKL